MPDPLHKRKPRALIIGKGPEQIGTISRQPRRPLDMISMVSDVMQGVYQFTSAVGTAVVNAKKRKELYRRMLDEQWDTESHALEDHRNQILDLIDNKKRKDPGTP